MNAVSVSTVFALALLVTGNALAVDESRLETAANPIRKVVTMMQKMAKKLEEEAEAEEELYEKFECYCKKTKESLEDAIEKAVSSAPISPDDIEAKKNEVLAIEDQVKELKGEKVSDENSLKAAKVNRKKEHDTFVKVVTEDKKTENAAEGALKALGVSTTEAPSFLQTISESGFGVGKGASWFGQLTKAFDRSKKVAPDQKEKVIAFLQGKGPAQQGDSADVQVYVEDIEQEAEQDIVVENKEEDHEVVDYGEVKKSKKDEIAALLDQMERKMKAIGDLQVEIVNMEHDMAGGAETLEDNKKMLAEITKSCEDKAADWEERKKLRADEQLAIADAIKMLNSDDALELFKKTIKKPTLIQLSASRKQALQKVKAIVDQLRSKSGQHRTNLNFLALALTGKKADFSSVFKKIDEMIKLMKKEQQDDDSKKGYCNGEFDASASKIGEINKKIEELEADMQAGKADMGKLDEEIAALQAGIKDLDDSIAEASENRKSEHAEFEELVAGNNAAVKLIGMAKNRLNKFYNPSVYETTTTTTANPLDPYAFVQVEVRRHLAAGHPAPVEVGAPPPTFDGDYKAKDESSNGVIKMMDTLMKDLEKEVTVATVEEKHGQKDYEDTVAEAKSKRESDVKAVAAKEQSKVDLGSDYEASKEEHKAKRIERMNVQKYVGELHGECDWLLANFDARKQGRIEEAESMTKAKAVLAGANFDF